MEDGKMPFPTIVRAEVAAHYSPQEGVMFTKIKGWFTAGRSDIETARKLLGQLDAIEEMRLRQKEEADALLAQMRSDIQKMKEKV